jgi:hypothetical protein
MLDRCRAGVGDTYSDREADLPAGAEHIDVRLIDQPGVNQHLDFVLLDTVRVVEQLRWAGRKVLIHCVQAQSRGTHGCACGAAGCPPDSRVS